jgi:SAM-dependent methyltransferase
VSKRDDDSQSDMEVGMTTAERRRRRRRGAGLRVPSDNVPRRTPTPPVVAPTPEDPSLAMSIAYSFTNEGSEPIPRATRDIPVPSFENHEAMPTVIDPVSGPIEQADFEMKTREMTAVDLEELGLVGASGVTLPVQRISSPEFEPVATIPSEVSGGEVRFPKRDATDPADDVDVEIDSGMEGMGDAGTTLDQDPDAEEVVEAEPAEPEEEEIDGEDDDVGSELSEVDGAAFSAIGATAPPRPAAASQARPPATDASQPRPPMTSTGVPQGALPTSAFKSGRAQTVTLSEDDLEEVREAARLSTQPPSRPGTTSIPPPMPAAKPPEAKPPEAKPPEAKPPAVEPPSVPEIDIRAIEDKVGETTGEFEVDVDGVDGIVEAKPAPVASPATPAAPSEPRTRQPSPPPVQGHPPASAPPAPSARESQPMPIVRDPLHASPPPPPSARESQPMPIVRDPLHASPPPPPVAHKAPPSPPPAKKDKVDKAPAPASAAASGKPDGKPPRGKPWFVDLFDEDYLRTLPFLTPQATQAEAEFVIDAMGLTPGAQVLDVGCGYGRHAMELAARGFHVVGLDMSTPLLVRGGEEAHRRGLTINFVRGDMRELDFEGQFNGAYCLFSTFGYFDDETNKKTVANIARALKPGGRVLIEILNRDYVIADLPTRVWWEGDGCVVLEEVELNYFSSRIQVNRSVVFDDGRQLEQEISVRAYSLHEVGKLLHAAGFRVLEVSGAYHTRGRFFGNQSRHIIVLAERKEPSAT